MSSSEGMEKEDRTAVPGEVRSVRTRPSYPELLLRYPRVRKAAPLVVFVTGFVWDSLTLNRIDHLLDNLVLLGYLVILALMIVLIVRNQSGALTSPRVLRFERHFHWITQFVLGGLLAKYVVFYFKSASWTRTSVFLVLLVALLVGNEFLKHRLENSKLLAVLFFFCLASFLAFFLPVVLRRVGAGLFLASGAVSLTSSLVLFGAAVPARGPEWRAQMAPLAVAVALAYGVLNVLYFANLIPPVPLALKGAGIFHRVARASDGYEVDEVPAPWYRYWKRWEDPFLLAPAEPVYCYSSIFAPAGIRVPVLHRWSRRDPKRGWIETDRIGFEISGGREGGFRGFTRKRAPTPGRWRVEIEMSDGRTLGRIDFTIVAAPSGHPPLVRRVIP